MKTTIWLCQAFMSGVVLCGTVGWASDPNANGEVLPASASNSLSAADESRTVAFLPGGTRLVVTAGRVMNVSNDGMTPWTLAQAMTPALRAAATASKLDRPVPVVIGLASPGVLAELLNRLADVGVAARWTEPGTSVPQLGLRIAGAEVERLTEVLADLDGSVVFADVQGGARLQNARSAWRCQSGIESSTPIFDHGLHGENQVIALMDTGIDPGSCFFADNEVGLPALNGDTGVEVDPSHRKILATDFWWDQDWPFPGPQDWDSSGHGTHTAGSAAGDLGREGLPDGNDGMAPAAKLVIQDGGAAWDDCGDLPGLGCPMKPLGPMLEQAWVQGARIHSNSWGDEENFEPFNRYTERTADIDRFVWQHPEMLVVAAAGNWGGDESTVLSPSTGKNVISVGAIWRADIGIPCPVDFSSRGWAHDGRIKPDLMAPGTEVVSAQTDHRADTSECLERPGSGTSMATPTVAGLAALVRQYLMEGWHVAGRKTPSAGFEPSAALVKAVLVASAVDLTTLGCSVVEPIPSRDQGWGLVELDRALWFEGDGHRLVVVDRSDTFDPSSNAESITVRQTVPGPLKVVLVWTDPPSTSTAAVNIVNDLDLEVEGPDGIFRGNVLVGGVSAEGGVADRLNTVEVVNLPEASAGGWTVRVDPHAVDVGPQGYALAVVGALDTSAGPRNAEDAGRAGPDGP